MFMLMQISLITVQCNYITMILRRQVKTICPFCANSGLTIYLQAGQKPHLNDG